MFIMHFRLLTLLYATNKNPQNSFTATLFANYANLTRKGQFPRWCPFKFKKRDVATKELIIADRSSRLDPC
jgi:hypothetical protein